MTTLEDQSPISSPLAISIDIFDTNDHDPDLCKAFNADADFDCDHCPVYGKGKKAQVSCRKSLCVQCWADYCAEKGYDHHLSECANIRCQLLNVDPFSIGQDNIEEVLGLTNIIHKRHISAARRKETNEKYEVDIANNDVWNVAPVITKRQKIVKENLEKNRKKYLEAVKHLKGITRIADEYDDSEEDPDSDDLAFIADDDEVEYEDDLVETDQDSSQIDNSQSD